MLSVRVTENVRSVQSSYYSSCPCTVSQIVMHHKKKLKSITGYQKLVKTGQKFSENCQKVVKKLPKSCQKTEKKLTKKLSKIVYKW
jgi:hypothetical protein